MQMQKQQNLDMAVIKNLIKKLFSFQCCKYKNNKQFQKNQQSLTLMEKQTYQFKLISQMLKTLDQAPGWKKYLKKNIQIINYQKTSILNLSSESLKKLYSNILKRNNRIKHDEISQKDGNHDYWYENQLRIFIYIMFGHLFLEKTHINQIKEQNFIFLNQLFPTKTKTYLEYQLKTIIKQKNSKWSKHESQLFQQITTKLFQQTNQKSIEDNQNNTSKNTTGKKWNFVAKQLYTLSNKKYFKTPKQCRQRWINYVDPNKIKGNWSLAQDLQLMTSIQQIGKKWTQISRLLNDTRSQNSVKNRYHSLIKKQMKYFQTNLNQQTLLRLTIQRIRKNIQNQQFNINIKRIENNQKQEFKKQQILDSISNQNKNNIQLQITNQNQSNILQNQNQFELINCNQSNFLNISHQYEQIINFKSNGNDFEQQLQIIQCNSYSKIDNFNQDSKWIDNYLLFNQKDQI